MCGSEKKDRFSRRSRLDSGEKRGGGGGGGPRENQNTGLVSQAKERPTQKFTACTARKKSAPIQRAGGEPLGWQRCGKEKGGHECEGQAGVCRGGPDECEGGTVQMSVQRTGFPRLDPLNEGNAACLAPTQEQGGKM